jgi:hypothetical protein
VLNYTSVLEKHIKAATVVILKFSGIAFCENPLRLFIAFPQNSLHIVWI